MEAAARAALVQLESRDTGISNFTLDYVLPYTDIPWDWHIFISVFTYMEVVSGVNSSIHSIHDVLGGFVKAFRSWDRPLKCKRAMKKHDP